MDASREVRKGMSVFMGLRGRTLTQASQQAAPILGRKVTGTGRVCVVTLPMVGGREEEAPVTSYSTGIGNL